MLPIQPVIQDICKALALEATESLKVLSRTLLDELQRTQSTAPLQVNAMILRDTQPAYPPSATATLTRVPRPSVVVRKSRQELTTAGEESRRSQEERFYIGRRVVDSTPPFIEEEYIYPHVNRLSLVILALWISVFITNAVSIRSSLYFVDSQALTKSRLGYIHGRHCHSTNH
jgi:hypothetical protein